MDFDLTKPMPLSRAVEAVAAALHLAMIRLRDHVTYGERDDIPDPLRAAHLLVAMLEDALREAESLVEKME
jgi:hypothetical protein